MSALPEFVSRVSENLEDASIADVLRLGSIVMEFVRDLLTKSAPVELRAELDGVMKPFIREMLTRAIELETRPPSRGNA